MAAKKSKTARKKRQLSKHVLQANEKRKAEEESGDQQNAALDIPNMRNNPTKKKVPAKNNKTIKDPAEAFTYLKNWEMQKNEAGGTAWKFNKNTQSWLIRHMYEIDKVSKATFTLLMDYLGGLQGDKSRLRIRAEASRRALRYKEYEKTNEGGKEGAEAGDNSSPSNVDDKSSQLGLTNEEREEDDVRWKNLTDHDKRKEYKRARKVLDVMQEK